MRPIDADDVIERLDMICDAGGCLSPVTKAVRSFCKGLINHQPTIENEPVKHVTELSIILQDYGIKDTDTLRYILDQYQKVIVEITHDRLSKLTYPADTIVNMEEDVSREYWEKELVKHGQWFGTVCSNCGSSDCNYFDHDYCPFCGSKNIEDGDGE